MRIAKTAKAKSIQWVEKHSKLEMLNVLFFLFFFLSGGITSRSFICFGKSAQMKSTHIERKKMEERTHKTARVSIMYVLARRILNQIQWLQMLRYSGISIVYLFLENQKKAMHFHSSLLFSFFFCCFGFVSHGV